MGESKSDRRPRVVVIGASVERTIAGGSIEEAVLDATNRRGRSINCRVRTPPLQSGNGDPRGVIVLMEET
jgi:hypothetical protein